MVKLLKNLKPYTGILIFTVFLLLVQSISNLYLPDLNANIINNGIANGDIDYIVKEGMIMLGVTLLLAICAIVSTYFSAKISMSFGRDLRGKIFKKVQTFSQKEIDKFGTASLITRNTNDVQQVQQLVQMGLMMMISAPIICIGGIIMALRQDLQLSWIIVAIVPVMGIIIGVFQKKALPLFKSMQKKIDKINLIVREKLSGIRVIRAFIRDESEKKKFDEGNLDLTETSLKVTRMMALLMPIFMFIFNLTSVAIVWFSGFRIDSGDIGVGNMTAFLTYVMQIMMSVMMAVMMFMIVPRASVSAERINEVLDTELTVNDSPNTINTFSERGHIEFKNVSFAYDGAETSVLEGISFDAKAGETTAVIGSTGSGKSTLINLIPRFYDVSGGGIFIDGTDIRELKQEDLRNKIGFIPQKAFLFSGTVASNLRYGNEDASDDELWHALEVAQGKDFIEEKEGKLDEEVSQGGSNFSGGQRQRLAIARALVKKPEIYIFDDSFSALDFKTDAKLREALKSETRESTVLIVAQRVSTIMSADRIIVLDEGKIAGMGTHKELLEACEVYREIVASQLSQEEIA